MDAKLQIVGMQNFQGTFETRKRSFISAFSIFMTVPSKMFEKKNYLTVISCGV